MSLTPDEQRGELALMQGVAAGDPAAIERLYDRFGSLVYRMAYQILPSRADAEDAVQEVFIRLWRTADRYDPTRAALVTWVMLITRRFLVDRLRRGRVGVKPTELDEKHHETAASHAGGEVDAASDQRESMAALMKRIDRLPELQRTVIVRAYLNGQTLRQIGEELNTPLGTIKSALSRALMRLRERDLGEGVPA
ncbi:sigma-70 family RNA polymerase sigma factor [soil metagenome]